MRILKPKGAKRHWQGHSDPSRAGSRALCLTCTRTSPLNATLALPPAKSAVGLTDALLRPNMAPTTHLFLLWLHLLTVTSFPGQKSKSPWYLQLHTPYSAHLESSYFYQYNLSWTWTLLTNLVHAWSAAVTSFWSPSLLSLWPLTGHSEQLGISLEHKYDNILFLA